MNVVRIPRYVFSTQKLGVFIDKLRDGDNLIYCTYKLVSGALEFPRGIIINKAEAIKAYGLSKIQKNSDDLGIWLPMRLFREANNEI